MIDKYMKLAIKEASKGINNSHGGPFGCVIVKDDVVVGKGHNMVIKKKDPTCHGAIMAIHQACKKLDSFDLSGCILYTTGEPCPMCMGAILWANIDKVYYGCNILDTEKIGFRDKVFYDFSSNKKNEMLVELDREACLKLYSKYSNLSNKTKY